MTTTTITLQIPVNRESSLSWIKEQSPTVVADVLGMSQSVHEAMIRGVNIDTQLKQLHESHDKQINALEQRFRLEKKELQTKAQKDIEDACNDQEKRYSKKIESLNAEIANCLEEINRFKSKEALIYERVSKEAQHQMAIEQDKCKRQMQSDAALFELKIAETQRRLIEKEQLVQSLEEKVQKQTEKNELLMQTYNEQQRQETEKYSEIVQRLSGTSIAKGNLGEAFVRRIHSQMELGEYEDTSGSMSAGFADGLWTYQPHNAVKLSVLVEVKNTLTLNSVHDLQKFHTDVTTALTSNRINAAIFISLKARHSGKPIVSLDTSWGVPVLWFCRDEDHSIPPDQFVRLAFITMAQIWPAISNKVNSTETTLVQVSQHLEEQIAEIDKITKLAANIEKHATSTLRDIKTLNNTRDVMISNIGRIRLQDARLSIETQVESTKVDFWDSESALIVMEQIRKFRDSSPQKNRYPKFISDLKLESTLRSQFETVPGAFELACMKVKEEKKRENKEAKQEAKRQKHI